MNPNLRNLKGFTLIELLVVIGILAVLLSITLIAINPARQFAQANNTKRASDVNAILNGIGQYMTDNNGGLPVSASSTQLTATACTSASPCSLSTAGVDICSSLVTKYLAALPTDPKTNNGTAVTACGTAYDTGYKVYVNSSDNRVTVLAPNAELSQSISVTR
jgi:type IV pilus assembly protein PilA